ncbi:MAG: 3-deoxy-D-manno-octulosonate cytidylyltransferase [Sulfurimonas sp. RIFOXYB2_FULL_37_5]|jgi:3-deoxy-manno-octulosonate cytidylyltransferase (CMP-KDO synthetase)|uniref:3-deoxy-manno-octulosonate cytidylyltransferase n=1 Tax=unclassified Sulfurimonas TaxID=2623549 RepID=UPI0008CB8B70|nr:MULTISPECIES: 3-deoxy-manno-octulosonate cytidylyltransferase [unclassified Sulfurimonas]MDO8261387.1 3-deoxy-manno-octulosonate cytidylyltransferase [Candidatus Magasanikbacteria bacterium]OHE11445.1 MAG: 3-deoxy-D-manno-octulosonate cytidylyltransferase [Sulfurimonas sp. RIFOXYB2_FULL_37_5]MBS4067459.1 3-deoxy-manno-octulosonate cytidylyltransferase [Sulfurimonas sp.]MDD3854083.1 3-deoxy-manno-octulosonate cytidylyltransferase [Sulfurimonas sp.]MDX9756613.1 3-deoxy-manno-octulosonate cyti
MIIIPARLASSRFPQKVLADIGGLPMVVRTAKRVTHLDRVVVAADDAIIIDVCKAHGVEAMLTSTTHKSGTDRINECANILNLSEDELIINVQADEPFIEGEVVEMLLKRLQLLKQKNESFIMASCYNSINSQAAQDPNLVKVVLDDENNAIYFSRSPIPFNRSGEAQYFGHIGIYGFSKKSLHEFCNLEDAPIEDIEKLEQLRAIYHQKKISMVKVASTGFGIDTEDDLRRAVEIFL